MAGKRQHYIPRFLQRGFLFDPQDDAERTWLHRRSNPARLVGIRDVGVSEYFYSKLRTDGVATLDDLITALERELEPGLTALRSGPVGDHIDSAMVSQLVSHLLLRTAHIRSIFAQAAIQVLDGVAASLFTDVEVLRGCIGVDSLSNSGPLHRAIDEALEKLPLGQQSFPRPLARRVSGFLARELFDSLFIESQPMFAQALAEIMTRIPAMVRDGHNRALETSKGEQWEMQLRKLHWFTQVVSGAVLPDCVVLAREAGRDFIPYLLSDRDSVDLVILPLAHDRLLIGSGHPNQVVLVESLNTASAACSDNFFISRAEADGAGLSDLIGRRSAKFIEDSVTDAISHSRPRRGLEADGSPVEQRVMDTQTGVSFSFSITCAGFADDEGANRIGKGVGSIVQELCRIMPLSALDGITFALDYPAAVRSLDRGDPTLEADSSFPREYGKPVAKCVRVVRHGVFKDHIVADAAVAGGLISDRPEERVWANHILVTMLTSIAYMAIYESKFAGATRAPPDEVARFLQQCISTLPSNYFCARESAFLDPTAGEHYAALFLDSLASARKIIEGARLQYRGNGSLDDLLAAAIPQISFVLGHAAEWLGHRDGLPELDAFPGAALPATVRSLELDRWLELFGRDLRTLFSADDQFTAARIFALSRHAERLLWTVQMFPWPTENGALYISVPWGEDAALLKSLPIADGRPSVPR